MGKERAQEALLIKREPKILSIEGDKVVVELDINGTYPSKEGKETHVMLSGSFKVPRSDGKNVTIGINAYYK